MKYFGAEYSDKMDPLQGQEMQQITFQITFWFARTDDLFG